MQKGFKQQQLAGAAGLHHVQYNRYKKGGAMPSTDTIARIAESLGVSVDYLLEGNTATAGVARFEDQDLLIAFTKLEKLSSKDKEMIREIIDALAMKRELQKQLVG